MFQCNIGRNTITVDWKQSKDVERVQSEQGLISYISWRQRRMCQARKAQRSSVPGNEASVRVRRCILRVSLSDRGCML